MSFNPDLTLNAIVVNLIATQDGRVPLTQGALAHAAFFDLVAAADPDLAARLHDSGAAPAADRRHIETVGGGGIGYQRKAEAPDQGRVFEEVGAQLTQRAQALVELDQVRGHVGRTRRRGDTGPGWLAGRSGKCAQSSGPSRSRCLRVTASWATNAGSTRPPVGPGEPGRAGLAARRRGLGGGCALPTQGGEGQGQAVASRGK